MLPYIAFEGIDGVGKTFCVGQVTARLREETPLKVVSVREPSTNAPAIPAASPWARALWYISDRSDMYETTVRPALESGGTVISDRSVYSTIAYQGGGAGLGREEIRTICQIVQGDIWPGLVLLLDCPISESYDRDTDPAGRPDRSFLERTAIAYREEAVESPHRVMTVDASADRSRVAAECYRLIIEYLQYTGHLK